MITKTLIKNYNIFKNEKIVRNLIIINYFIFFARYNSSTQNI